MYQHPQSSGSDPHKPRMPQGLIPDGRLPGEEAAWGEPEMIAHGYRQLFAIQTIFIAQYHRNRDSDYLMHELHRIAGRGSPYPAVRTLVVNILESCGPKISSFSNLLSIKDSFLAAGDYKGASKLIAIGQAGTGDREIQEELAEEQKDIELSAERGTRLAASLQFPIRPGREKFQEYALEIAHAETQGNHHALMEDLIHESFLSSKESKSLPQEVLDTSVYLVQLGKPALARQLVSGAIEHAARTGSPYSDQSITEGYCEASLPEEGLDFSIRRKLPLHDCFVTTSCLAIAAAQLGSRLPPLLPPDFLDRALEGDTSSSLLETIGFLAGKEYAEKVALLRSKLTQSQRLTLDYALIRGKPGCYQELDYHIFAHARTILGEELKALGTHPSEDLQQVIKIFAGFGVDSAAKQSGALFCEALMHPNSEERAIVEGYARDLHLAYLGIGTHSALRGNAFLTLSVLGAQLCCPALAAELLDSLAEHRYGSAAFDSAERFFGCNPFLKLPKNLTRAYFNLLTQGKPDGKALKILKDAGVRFFKGPIDEQPEQLTLYFRTLLAHGSGDIKREILKAARSYFEKEDFSDPMKLRAFCGAIEQEGTLPDRQKLLTLAKRVYASSGIESPLLRRIVASFKSKGQTVHMFDFAEIPDGMALGEFIDLQPQRNQRGKNLQTLKENEFMMRLVLDSATPVKVAAFLLKRLAASNYIDKSVPAWINAEEREGNKREAEFRRAVFSSVLDTGIVPSLGILEAVSKAGTPEKIRAYVKELEDRYPTFLAQEPLQSRLARLSLDSEEMLAYFISFSPRTRFDLIANYPYERFQEIIHLTTQRQISDLQLNLFEAALIRGGMQGETARQAVINLREGHAPVLPEGKSELSSDIRLDISNNALLASANKEISAALSSRQLGAILRSVLYRSFLETVSDGEEAQAALINATTFEDKARILKAIEQRYPDFGPRAEAQLKTAWENLSPQVRLDFELRDILFGKPKVKAEDVFQGIEMRRRSLKASKSAVLQALKGSNPQLSAKAREISRKERAQYNLEMGLAKNPEAKDALEPQILQLKEEITTLRSEVAELSAIPIINRYSELSADERKERLKKEQKEFQTLTEKDPASLLTYLVASLLDEDLYLEADAELLKEVASHLQSPFDTVRSLAHLDVDGQARPVPREVRLRYLDKSKDLMTMARFADSKVCCYSSNNYEMVVAHKRPNKEFLAARIADPMSFVWVVEEDVKEEDSRAATRNLGFIMGEFGLTEDQLPAISLNGIYLVTGNEQRGAESVLNAIEDLLAAPLGVKRIIVGGTYGGALSELPQGYREGHAEVTRLRALLRDGEPDSENYDDLGKEMNCQVNIGTYHKERSL